MACTLGLAAACGSVSFHACAECGRAALPCFLLLQVEELLPKGAESIPQLSVALVTISKALDSEMAAMPAHEVGFLMGGGREVLGPAPFFITELCLSVFGQVYLLAFSLYPSSWKTMEEAVYPLLLCGGPAAAAGCVCLWRAAAAASCWHAPTGSSCLLQGVFLAGPIWIHHLYFVAGLLT